MNIGDMLRERAINDAVQELCKLARGCDNLWQLTAAIAILKGEKEIEND